MNASKSSRSIAPQAPLEGTTPTHNAHLEDNRERLSDRFSHLTKDSLGNLRYEFTTSLSYLHAVLKLLPDSLGALPPWSLSRLLSRSRPPTRQVHLRSLLEPMA